MNTLNKIILFDGVCNFCNNSINFIIDHDKSATFQFASLQSEIGIQLLKRHKIDSTNTDSIVLISNNQAYLKSTAALLIAKQLDGIWKLLSVFLIIPQFIRDNVYELIAKNRYKWFGKLEACRMPTPPMRTRFLK